MIELFVDLISFIITIMIVVWLGIFLIKFIGTNSKRHKLSKKDSKAINKFEKNSKEFVNLSS